MKNNIFSLQQTIKNLKQQITDVLHLASLNNQSIICLASTQAIPNQQIKLAQRSKSTSQNPDILLAQSKFLIKKHKQLSEKLNKISLLFEKRVENHLNYLIVKQIEAEQQSVRRDRLNEYEQKIYDQRRLISDKQLFLQSLYRPRKKRPQLTSLQQFQEIRAKQRVQEEKDRISNLERQIQKLAQFQKYFKNRGFQKSNQSIFNSPISSHNFQSYQNKKNDDLQNTRSSSIDTVNLFTVYNSTIQRIQQIVEQTQFDTIVNLNLQMNSNLKIKQPQNVQNTQKSENPKQFSEKKQSENLSIKVQKFIDSYRKNSMNQEQRERFFRIKETLYKIGKKKEQNLVKKNSLIELLKQNDHLFSYLRKVKKNYITLQKSIQQKYKISFHKQERSEKNQ